MVWSNSYDELIDHPIEMEPETLELGVPHEIAITGDVEEKQTSWGSTAFVVEIHLLEWQHPDRILPSATDSGYGGLEHRLLRRWYVQKLTVGR